MRHSRWLQIAFSALLPIGQAPTSLGRAAPSAAAPVPASSHRTIVADVVALDQAFYNNRLGAFQAGGMIFALRSDVVSNDPSHPELTAGHVMLRPDKRARPIVLRMNMGDCLQVNFQNFLADVPSLAPPPSLPFQPGSLKTTPDPNSGPSPTSQSATRVAGLHVMGTELKEVIDDDASWIGNNPDGQVKPNESKTYKFCATGEGAFLLYSTAANIGFADGFGGQITQGLFGSVVVEPPTAEWYRSQVTRADLDLATYNAGQLPSNMTLTPKGNPQETFTADGQTYKLWTLTKTGPGAFTAEVTETNLAGNPVNQGGLLKTRDFHPIINYQARYPNGTPILAMMDSATLKIVHSDLTAIITGPNAGRFLTDNPSPAFLPNPVYPDRLQPYREFAIHYHDDPMATQAFPEFGPDPTKCSPGDPNCSGVNFALQAARDFFAINYGMAAIGPEVLANRLHVGPMAQCATCKFEEFFLSSWAVGDPAMVVDIPANNALGKTATKALYPDDPSNVYHSYMGDHVQFRILHAGANITHVHHQHAHQWLHSPNSDESDYRDSQMLSPGDAYTLDMSYFGSGNLNQTVGDSIFHCHFYPHFAQGMWSMWRVHDVFEAGTQLDANEVPVADWNRALPDGEIPNGTPIPAVVPMPTLAMAPFPIKTRVCPVYQANDYVQFAGDSCLQGPPGAKPVGYKAMVSKKDMDDPSIKEKNPGYPFFMPGVAGQRPPHPPLDLAPDEDANGNQKVVAGQKQYLDGGLPRSQFLKEDGTLYEQHNARDFTKENDKLLGVEVPEEGTDVEKLAMAAHAVRQHPSVTPEGQTANFILNGQGAKPGAPFADPAVDINGNSIPNADCAKHQVGCVRYKAADIQLDVVLNKKGWHYPQQRILSLWGDVKANLDGARRPEPLFFRANSDQVVEYWLSDLVPTNYELDDFQVRTPTDIIGQHIHLVKFDVTSSDGAGNGFNYEDGTFSNEEVVSLIDAANKDGGLFSTDASHRNNLTAKEIPYFAQQFPNKFPGAQATIQRWYADPIRDNAGQDRTMRTVFTHDHFGPSTHQQVGLYAGLVVEPKDSKWFNSSTGEPLGGRFDGGPTTFQANVNLADPAKSYREFLLEFQDRQLAYTNNSISTPKPYERYGPTFPKKNPGGSWGWADPDHAINAPNGVSDFIPAGLPTPDLITNQIFEGTYSLNYLNEPLSYRVATGTPDQTDLINVFRSITRGDPALNCQPVAGAPINPAPNCGSASTEEPGFKYAPPQAGTEPHDPYTPLLRAYEGENVQIRNLVGAHMAPHSFHIHGLNWQFEPSVESSGFRSTQGMGISEHYELLFQLPVTAQPNRADYLYMSTSDVVGLQYGNWGLIRGYKQKQGDLVSLSETQAKAFPYSKPTASPGPPAVCPANAPQRKFDVTAVYAPSALGGPLVYNSRGAAAQPGQTFFDQNALMYVLTADLDNGKLKTNAPREPLILRAAAGDCITVALMNGLPVGTTLNGGVPAQGTLGNLADPASPINLTGVTFQTSYSVGMHPQLLAYDVTTSDGFNIGSNPAPETAKPGDTVTYTWYAGRVTRKGKGKPIYTPVEFGAVNLAPADALMQDNYGLVGALIIEPQGSTWREDQNTRAGATVLKADKTYFREGVAVFQDDLANVGAKALNYRTEPFSYRYVNPDFLVNANLTVLGISRSQSDTLVTADPQTPVFVAGAGTPFRLRVLHPAGLNEEVFDLHGHGWQEEPYSKQSTKLVDYNPLSQWTGSRGTFGANSSFDAVLTHAGGVNGVKGDYLFRTFIAADFQDGMWGLLRIGEPGKDVVTVTSFCASPGGFTVSGVNTVNPSNNLLAKNVTISGTGINNTPVTVDTLTGRWSATIAQAPPTITVTSAQGGVETTPQICPIQAPPPSALAPNILTQAPRPKPSPNKVNNLDRFRQRTPTPVKPQ
jgi:manganese oxidase